LPHLPHLPHHLPSGVPTFGILWILDLFFFCFFSAFFGQTTCTCIVPMDRFRVIPSHSESAWLTK
jgi:hypothetical protein